MTLRTVLTVAHLTVREASRRKVLRALAGLMLALLGLSTWGFAKLSSGLETEFGSLTTGEAKLVAAQVLNLVMFGMSMIAALGTAFLAGPTLSGEIESGMSLSVLARPVRRSDVLVGKWLGLILFGSGFVALSGLAQFVVVQVTVGYWPPEPVAGLALLAAQTTVLLTLGLLLSTVISPMASGIVAVGLFCATWIAGVVGGVGVAVGNDGVAKVGTVSRMILPTDGLWRGAMHAFQDPVALAQFSGPAADGGFPFFSKAALTTTYLGWTLLWVVLVLGLAGLVFQRRDL
jgi:ABC-type transport system involved in multi-copper enzyme maturation permease subunit